jgi:hypothetical protein
MVKDFNLLIQMLLAPVVVVSHLQYKNKVMLNAKQVIEIVKGL